MPALPLPLTLRVPQPQLAARRLPPLMLLAPLLRTRLDRARAQARPVETWVDSSLASVAAAQLRRRVAWEVCSADLDRDPHLVAFLVASAV